MDSAVVCSYDRLHHQVLHGHLQVYAGHVAAAVQELQAQGESLLLWM